jgi:beta-galactosidase
MNMAIQKRLRCFFILGVLVLLTNHSFAQQNISLAGNWKVALDQTDEGILKRWYQGKLQNDIALPGTTDLAKMGMPEQTPWINFLFRQHKYIGAAWYQKEIEIPAAWKGYTVDLLLERVLWESRVWIDGKETDKPDDGLTVAHIHSLGQLVPGHHIITIRVNNSMIHPIGDKGHNYTELTQSIWNGIAGRMELIKKGQVATQQVRVFADAASKQVNVETTLQNSIASSAVATLTIIIKNSKDAVVAQISKKVALAAGANKINTLVKTKEAALWSEFQQPLYTVQTIVEANNQQDVSSKIIFGFRQIGTKYLHITINNSPVFIRGNQDCLTFPLTGYPATDVASWKRIFQLYKAYGFNQVRFHSACPPDAAFEAADEVGIYVMVEVIWITSRNAMATIRPTSVTTGLPQGLGKADRTIDSFVVKETNRILEQYGNHPSFCFFAYGNEMDNLDKKVVNEWLATIKTNDPRWLYSATTARSVLPNDDFQDSHLVPGGGFIVNNYAKTGTRWSYDTIYAKSKVPVIAHELGQIPVYPNWDELLKYTGPLKPINLLKAKEKAIVANIVSQHKAFQKASGYLQKILYKEEVESQFRSANSAGFNMLAMNDYPGQGEALTGWFDSFWDTKGTIKPEEFSQWNSTAVPLAQFNKYVWKGGEKFSATVQLAYFDQLQITTGLHWSLVSGADNRVIQQGQLAAQTIQPGSLVTFGNVTVILPLLVKATSFHLRVTVSKTAKYNEWKFWLFPKQQELAIPENIIIVDRIDTALNALTAGKKVLLIADKLGNPSQKNLAAFKPVFWSTVFFPDQGAQTLGAVIKNTHPALKGFPTGDVLDRQWQELCSTARGTILDGEANTIEPIVQPIDDFHNNRKLGSIFELKVGKGALLICGYDIKKDIANRPEALQLSKSLLSYMGSANFNPVQEVSTAWLKNKFYYIPPDTSKAPKGFSNAIFYTYAGLKAPAGESIWQPDFDQVTTNGGNITCKVENGMVYKDNAFDNYGWKLKNSQPLKVRLGVPQTTLGSVFLKVKATDASAHNITVIIEGRKNSFVVNKEQWIRVEFFREDFEDNELYVEALDTSGTGVLITDLVIVPES